MNKTIKELAVELTINDAVSKICDYQFEVAWTVLKSKYPKEILKVKENFIKPLSKEIHINCLKQFSQRNLQISTTAMVDIVNYVFHYHLLHTSHLSDSERSSLQKDKSYKEEISNYILEVMLRRACGLIPKTSATIYNPEIYTCDFLCDFFIAITEPLKLNNLSDDDAVRFNTYDDAVRFNTLQNLFMRAFGSVKNILNQLTQSFPSEAIISWRTLFEIEYKILVLVKYDAVLSRYYQKFSEYSFLDEDSDGSLWKEFEDVAIKFNKKTSDFGFRNYGWILVIKDQGDLKTNLKSLLKIAKYNEYDHEQRYRSYQDACQFSHSNAFTLDVLKREPEQYAFVISNLFISIQNLKNAWEEFLNQFNIPQTKEQEELLNTLFEKYKETYFAFKK